MSKPFTRIVVSRTAQVRRIPVRPYGRRSCSYCGKSVTKNALGYAAHARGAQCQLDGSWRDGTLGRLLFLAKRNSPFLKDADVDRLYWLVRSLASAGLRVLGNKPGALA